MADQDIQGQVSSQAPEGQPGGDIQSGQVEKPFYQYESQAFKTPDELSNFIKSGTMMHSDYTKKTQTLAEERKRYENERAEHNRQYSEWDKKIDLYKKADELFKANPRAFQQVQQMIKQGASGSDVQEIVEKAIEEKVGPKLSEFEKYQKTQQAKAERDRYFGELKGKYQDFDEKSVQSLYDELMGEGSNMGTLAEMLYFAHKGKGLDPAKAKQEVIDDLEKKGKAGFPTTKGASYASDKKLKAKNMDRLAEQIKAGIGEK